MPSLRRAVSALAAAGSLAVLASGAVASGTTTATAPGPVSTAKTAPAAVPPVSARHKAQRPYLALGDSVPFGYISGDGYAYRRPGNFIGYPTYAGRWLHLRTVNAACPGEATGGFISATDPDDNGCRAYRAAYPLHVRYRGTQLQFASRFLGQHRRTALVTIMLGANDGFRLEKQCAGDMTCVLGGLHDLLQQITGNLTSAVRTLRASHYRGPIMIVDYYSTDYANAQQTLLSTTLDDALDRLASARHLLVADGLGAMKYAAASAGGDTCAAGLLNASPSDPTTCDVHPSQTGQRVLAAAVKRAYLAWKAAHPRA